MEKLEPIREKYFDIRKQKVLINYKPLKDRVQWKKILV